MEQMSGARVVLIVPTSSFPNISSSFLANNSIMEISSSPPWHLPHGVTKSSECHPISENLTTRFAKKNSFRETKAGIIKVKLKLKKRFLLGQQLLKACALGDLGQVKLLLKVFFFLAK